MRHVFTISLPAAAAQQVKTVAKRRGYASLSAYIHNLLKADEDLISETALLQAVRHSRQEYRRGKAIRARSMADLV